MSKTTDYYIDIMNEAEDIIAIAKKYNSNVKDIHEAIGYCIIAKLNKEEAL